MRGSISSLTTTRSPKRASSNVQVAVRLLQFEFERNELVAALQRAPVERREFAEQLARARRVGADERSDRVDGVEQEVRVDLRLQRLELHARRELGLPLELGELELGGEHLREALGHGDLRLVEQPRSRVVELQRPDRLTAHLQRHDDGRVELAVCARTADLVLGRQHARLVVLDRLARGARDDRALRPRDGPRPRRRSRERRSCR